jgi:hypothetical protein
MEVLPMATIEETEAKPKPNDLQKILKSQAQIISLCDSLVNTFEGILSAFSEHNEKLDVLIENSRQE